MSEAAVKIPKKVTGSLTGFYKRGTVERVELSAGGVSVRMTKIPRRGYLVEYLSTPKLVWFVKDRAPANRMFETLLVEKKRAMSSQASSSLASSSRDTESARAVGSAPGPSQAACPCPPEAILDDDEGLLAGCCVLCGRVIDRKGMRSRGETRREVMK